MDDIIKGSESQVWMPVGWPEDAQESGIQFGACDPLFRGDTSALNPRRFATGFLALTRDAGTGTLSIAASGTAPSFRLFTKGRTESGAEAGFTVPGGAALNLSDAECDVYKDGAMVEGNGSFRIAGLGVEIGLPFSVDAAGVRSGLVNTDSYFERIVRVVSAASFLVLQHGESQPLPYRLGQPSFYPSSSGLRGQLGASYGTPRAATFNPFRVPSKTANAISSAKVQVQFFMAWGASFPSDPAAPTTASLLLPVRVEVYGEPSCAPVSSGQCDVGGGGIDYDKLAAAIVRRIKSSLDDSGNDIPWDCMTDEAKAETLEEWYQLVVEELTKQ